MQIAFSGAEAYRAKLMKIAAKVKENVDEAVAESGDDLLARSLLVTPYEPPGDELRESGYVEHTEGTAEVGYRSRIAFYVHEMGITVYPERAPIEWTTPGTHAKFLEGPFLENRQRYAENIKDAAKRGLE